ncbi:MAG: MarR family transcriptional regulator [Actinomycetota bacterium]|nr:MarR family transcriptional regulator [Actinomycetota bacterium]
MPVHTEKPLRSDAGLASALASSIVRLSRRLRTERHSDLTPNQLSALGTMRSNGALTLSALAAYERVQPPSMNRTVNCLDELGMIRRVPDPEDRRQVLLHVSDAGNVTLDAERDRRDAWLHRRLEELDPEDREALRSAAVVLERLGQA